MKSHLAFAQRLVTLMDTKFTIFGIRFGIDPILDVLPGFGSLIGAGISCYLFWIAYQLKVPSRVYWRMGWHILLDYLLGLLLFIGVVVDLFLPVQYQKSCPLVPLHRYGRAGRSSDGVVVCLCVGA